MAKVFNENLELCTLSCLFKNGSLFPIVEDILERSDFGSKSLGVIYQSIVDIVQSDLYPDVTTVQAELDRKGLLDVIKLETNGLKGRDALEFIASSDANLDNLESYVYQIKDLRGLRQLLELKDYISKSVEDGKRPIEILSDIDIKTGKIASFVGAQSKNTRTSKEVAISNIEQFQDTANGKSHYIATGLDAWDDYVGGLFPRLYMIAAEQNEGKSSLVINLINNISIQFPKQVENWIKTKVKLFTFESSAEEINNKIVQLRTGISQIKIEKGLLSESELTQYESALKEISESPILYDDSPELTLPLLRTKIRKACADGAQVIFIDQLEQVLVGGSGDLQQEHIRLNYITYRIKAYQREMNIPIVLVHQRKKAQETEGQSRDPQLNDLNQAGGKAPDAVLMVRTKKEPAFFWVKNRQGGKGMRYVDWDGSRIRFSDRQGTNSLPEFIQDKTNA